MPLASLHPLTLLAIVLSAIVFFSRYRGLNRLRSVQRAVGAYDHYWRWIWTLYETLFFSKPCDFSRKTLQRSCDQGILTIKRDIQMQYLELTCLRWQVPKRGNFKSALTRRCPIGGNYRHESGWYCFSVSLRILEYPIQQLRLPEALTPSLRLEMGCGALSQSGERTLQSVARTKIYWRTAKEVKSPFFLRESPKTWRCLRL